MKIRRLIMLYQNFFWAAFGAVVALGIAGLVFVPAVQSVIKLYKNVNLLRDETNELSKKSELLASLDEESLNQNLLTATSAIPIDKSLSTIFSTIDGVSAQTGATVFDISLDSPGALSTDSAKPVAKQLSSAVAASVIVKGGYDQVTKFLTTIGNVRRFLLIDDLNFSIQSFENVTLNLDLLAPYGSVPLNTNVKFVALSAVEEATLGRLGSLPLMISAVPLPPPQIGQAKDNPFVQ